MSKHIDAVDLVRQVRDDIYEQTKEMSTAELVEFFRSRGSSAKERIADIQGHRRAPVKRDSESH
jgi:hypothetical protein